MLRPCKQCGCDFEVSKARKMFCSPECRIIGTRERRVSTVVNSRKEAACINKKIRALHRKVPDPLAENGHPPLPNTEVRTCIVCNHPYSATFSLQKYGSVYCYRKEANKRALEKRRENAAVRKRKFAVAKTGACACCGKNFIKRRSSTKFCSYACSHQGRLRSSAEISRTCSTCGSTFNRQAPFAKYCSLDCKTEAMKVRKPMKEKPKGYCKHCEKEFVKKKSDSVFCCNQCRIDADRLYGHPNCRKSALRSRDRTSKKEFTPKENKTTAYARKLRSNPF